MLRIMANVCSFRVSLCAAVTIASFSARADMFDEWQQPLRTPDGKTIMVRFWAFSVGRSFPGSFETPTLPNPFPGAVSALGPLSVGESLLSRPGRMSIGGQWRAASNGGTVSE